MTIIQNSFSILGRDKHEFQKDRNQDSGPDYNTRAGRITGDILFSGVDLRDLLDDHFSASALDDGDDLTYDRDGNRN